ncbi:hypothetical protein U1Q18_052525 [Sarracenia purpurea var. burkii]
MGSIFSLSYKKRSIFSPLTQKDRSYRQTDQSFLLYKRSIFFMKRWIFSCEKHCDTERSIFKDRSFSYRNPMSIFWTNRSIFSAERILRRSIIIWQGSISFTGQNPKGRSLYSKGRFFFAAEKHSTSHDHIFFIRTSNGANLICKSKPLKSSFQ